MSMISADEHRENAALSAGDEHLQPWLSDLPDEEAWLPDTLDSFEQAAYFDSYSNRCTAILSWAPALEEQDHSLSRDFGPVSSPVWELRPPHKNPHRGPNYDAWSAGHRLSALLSEVRQTVEEFYKKAQPSEAIGSTVSHLQKLVAECLNREEQTSELHEGRQLVQPKHQLVDWRTINREQARGLPEGLLSEDGYSLVKGHRVRVFDVFVPEPDEEE